MTDLDVMLNWYAPDVKEYALNCVRCGCVVQTQNPGGRVLCDGCRNDTRYIGRGRTGSPEFDIALAVIRRAAEEARAGDRDAAQWLVGRDGAELWLRALGIGITEEMRNKLKALSIGKT